MNIQRIIKEFFKDTIERYFILFKLMNASVYQMNASNTYFLF